jgi:hypothetical protein
MAENIALVLVMNLMFIFDIDKLSSKVTVCARRSRTRYQISKRLIIVRDHRLVFAVQSFLGCLNCLAAYLKGSPVKLELFGSDMVR